MVLTNTAEPFAVGYLNANKYDDAGYRIGSGLLNQAKHMPISINDDEFFAGKFDINDRGVKSIYGHTVIVNDDILDEEIASMPDIRAELEYIKAMMKPLDSREVVKANKTEQERLLTEMRACWGGDWGGHGNPDFGMFVHTGTRKIIEKIERYRNENKGKDSFYEGLILSMRALEVLAKRYAALAEKLAGTAEPKRRNQLLRIKKCLSHCPKEPARDFFEACQMFWLIFSFTDADSPGRFDRYMIDYYRMSPEADAVECMRELWQRFYLSRTWNLCISGSDENGNDMTNELSYLILRIAAEYKYNTPNLTMRVHHGTPDRLYDEAIKTISTGIGMPVIYNDECVCPMLISLGIEKADAYNYCMNGCNQIDIFGKSHMGLEDGEVSLIKALELMLFRGVCSISKKKIGMDAGDPDSFDSYESFIAAYKAEVEYITDITVKMANDAQKTYAKIAPNPLRSCLIEGCIEKGRDYTEGGPVYNHGQILAEGIADTVDSIAAIKHYIFDERKYTFRELTEALKSDFVGYDELYHDFGSYKKFGNDEDEVDMIAADIVEHFFRYLMTKRTYRGGIYTGGCSPFNRAAYYGEKVGAMPDGKRKNDPVIADSIGSVPGEDTGGPTALLRSVLKYNQSIAGSGFVLNLKFNKSIFETNRGACAVKSLMKAYYNNGGQQISPTVVSPEELKDAMLHPEKHKDLIVRVGGYSDYFIRLSDGLKENVYKRTVIGA